MQAATIVVPTYDEASNIDPLVKRLRQALEDWHSTILFVDDSPDRETYDAVMFAADRYATPTFQVQSYRRTNGLVWGSLAGAVTDGLRQALTPYAVVMDADLQHPPELLPHMLEIVTHGKDLVVGSRYCPGGSSSGLNSPIRHAVSVGSTYAAKLLFPIALRGVTDPMTGFYAVRMEAINPHQFKPMGFKILLETIVRHHKDLEITEVAMQFATRHSGNSTTADDTFQKGVTYLRHLMRLRLASWRESFRRPNFVLRRESERI